GFSIPENSANCMAGSYYIERTEKDLLVITAVGRAIGNDKTNPIKYSCTIDNSGKSELMKLN
ncbi:MAG: hypothetical protein Q8903_09515, partial [Bacteroidota bacterium]|nr:hypothetical protein [Bacteroidota bacterium]